VHVERMVEYTQLPQEPPQVRVSAVGFGSVFVYGTMWCFQASVVSVVLVWSGKLHVRYRSITLVV
jgi:hypothetical protein